MAPGFSSRTFDYRYASALPALCRRHQTRTPRNHSGTAIPPARNRVWGVQDEEHQQPGERISIARRASPEQRFGGEMRSSVTSQQLPLEIDTLVQSGCLLTRQEPNVQEQLTGGTQNRLCSRTACTKKRLQLIR